MLSNGYIHDENALYIEIHHTTNNEGVRQNVLIKFISDPKALHYVDDGSITMRFSHPYLDEPCNSFRSGVVYPLNGLRHLHKTSPMGPR